MLQHALAAFRRLCDHLDGPDGRLVFVALFVVLTIALIVHDAYGRVERRRDR